jgi:hypothetical protein
MGPIWRSHAYLAPKWPLGQIEMWGRTVSIKGWSHGAILAAIFILPTGHTQLLAQILARGQNENQKPKLPPKPTLSLESISICSQTRRSAPPPQWAVLLSPKP